jgi:FAD/FMN-containing dehydrogenase
MIDLSTQRSVTVDPGQRRARCGGGTRWAELDAACQQHGLAVTGGMISHTGVAGLTLGGGLGWLHTKLGLSCDNLASVEIATADGRILRASEREHAELFWALRGGGGNFGVVTEFEFKLSPIGPIVQLGAFFYELERGKDMFRLANQLTRELDDDTSVFLCGLDAPPAPFVPAAHHGRSCYAILMVGLGAAEAHARLVDNIRGALAPLFELVTPIPYTALQTMFDASAPWGIHAYEKAVYLDDLSDAAIDVIVRQFPRKRSPLSFMPVLVLGGQYARVSEAAVAFGGKRSTRFAVNITGMTQDPAAFEAEVAWAREFWSELVTHADDVGSYVNYIVEPDQERVRASYGEAKYARLAAIKAEYDPHNVFHLNANIRPRQA